MPKRILVIEDEFDVREDIHELLDLEGYDVYLAENGLIGLEMASKLMPDLIICDIMMPGIDGFEVLNRLQQQEATHLIPFVFLTARATLDDLRHGMTLGADDYLTKPFTLEQLLNAVHTRLRKEANRQIVSESRLEELRQNLAYSLPHELRTPLVSILGYSELLLMDSDDEYIRSAAETINESGKRLHHLIENYLLFAQLEVIQTDPQRLLMLDDETPDAKMIIETEAHIVAEKANRLPDLQLHVVPGYIKIATDNLNKIINELVDNAFKFSEPQNPVSISSAVQQGMYIIRIQDQGRGMSPQNIRGIGAYQQFGRKLYEQQGSGLGLAIAKKLIELYQGQLDLESEEGHGTVITIMLPAVN